MAIPGGGAKDDPGRRRVGSWMKWLIPIAIVALFLAPNLLNVRQASTPSIDYSTFFSLVQQAKVKRVEIDGQSVRGALKAGTLVDGKKLDNFSTTLPAQPDQELMPALRAQDVDVYVQPASTSWFGPLMITIIPWVLILGAWVLLSRRARGSLGVGGPLQQILKSRTRRFERQDHVRVRLDDVAGLKNPKRDLSEVIEFLRSPGRFQRLGGRLPRGVLLIGPPGTGKTLLARAVAGEAEAPFFYVNGSEFIQMFVGVGAARVRELFDEAKASAPAIVFIDEIDAVGRSRGAGLGGGNDEREQTLNQLLSEMDGFAPNDLIVVLAATNRPDVLDPALLRPGRFDRHILVDHPECPARVEILRVHTRRKPLSPDVSLLDLARATPGFSGADLANLCNEAALMAVRRGADAIGPADFAAATDKVLLGDLRETLLDTAERRRVATHEAGHAVVAHFTPEVEPLRRVSILPRGMSLGATQQWPASDRHLLAEPELAAKLMVLMGGYAAESVEYGNVSSGSEQDLRQATDFAFQMVAHYGMSEKVGPMYHEHRLEHAFLGQRLATERGVSDETTHELEQEAHHVLSQALDAAKGVIERRRAVLERLVAALLEHETLEAVELEAVWSPPVAA
ncbi:MAG TPA: ATP-dependent zinc metalloprotease FtsH [Polyangiaceae bacterium]|nr:ATP-dependent zinc metalloprotease FtsH [Polyangiaceae bacterium]